MHANAGLGALVGTLAGTAIGVGLYTEGSTVIEDVGSTRFAVGSSVGGVMYTREMEREADHVAAYIVHEAGYELEAGQNLWIRLAREVRSGTPVGQRSLRGTSVPTGSCRGSGICRQNASMSSSRNVSPATCAVSSAAGLGTRRLPATGPMCCAAQPQAGTSRPSAFVSPSSRRASRFASRGGLCVVVLCAVALPIGLDQLRPRSRARPDALSPGPARSLVSLLAMTGRLPEKDRVAQQLDVSEPGDDAGVLGPLG